MTATSARNPLRDPQRHRFYEDVLALFIATLFTSLGIFLYSEATLLTGSAAGLALLIQYGTGYPFGIVFFIINLPFYVLAMARMGWRFTLRTFAAVTMLSVFSRFMPDWISLSHLSPAYASIVGGMLIGMGVLAVFRHRAALGGMNILALYMQDRFGMRAGWLQLGVDLCILVAAFFMLPWDKVLLSVVGAVVLNVIVALNHRPGRYVGMS